jgi:hypothetical protein
VIYHVRDPIRGREPVRQKGKPIEYQEVIIDEGESDKRLLLIEPEFGGVLQALGRNGNYVAAKLAQLLKVWLARFEMVETGDRGRPVERWFAEGPLRENAKNAKNPRRRPGAATEGWEVFE